VIAVGNLTRSCAPGAERAAKALGENTSSPQGLRNIEYEIYSTKRVRICLRQAEGRREISGHLDGARNLATWKSQWIEELFVRDPEGELESRL
jgi:hypothetical protein